VNEPPLVTGTYNFATPQGKGELTGAATIVLPGGVGVTFTLDSIQSDVQVTAISDAAISGTFQVKDDWSEISGTFTAPVK
jgi:expansin (peptidoglycan-binding protein)